MFTGFLDTAQDFFFSLKMSNASELPSHRQKHLNNKSKGISAERHSLTPD